MRLYNAFTAAVVLLWLTGCSSLSVNYDYNQQVDFTQYITYDWLPLPKDMKVDELNRTRFVTAVENNLAGKGLTQSSTNPDFMIAAHFGRENKVDIQSWGYSYAPNSYYGGYGYRHPGQYGYTGGYTGGYAGGYAAPGGVSVYEYELGTLILDFVDTKTKQLIWRATAEAIVTPTSTPEKQTEKINNAVKQILDSFPPGK